MKGNVEQIKLMVRLPADVKSFLQHQAAVNANSQNSEIIRSVRERMERLSKQEAAIATSE